MVQFSLNALYLLCSIRPHSFHHSDVSIHVVFGVFWIESNHVDQFVAAGCGLWHEVLCSHGSSGHVLDDPLSHWSLIEWYSGRGCNDDTHTCQFSVVSSQRENLGHSHCNHCSATRSCTGICHTSLPHTEIQYSHYALCGGRDWLIRGLTGYHILSTQTSHSSQCYCRIREN